MEKWSIGKTGGCVITDNHEGFKESTGHAGDDAVKYYGGTLICESVWREKDAHLISAAPDLLYALIKSVEILEAEGLYVHDDIYNAIKKATNDSKFNYTKRK